MGFSRQEYWSGLPFPAPGDLPDPGLETASPALQANSLPTEPPGKPYIYIYSFWFGLPSFTSLLIHSLINIQPHSCPYCEELFKCQGLGWSSPCFGPQESASSTFYMLLTFLFLPPIGKLPEGIQRLLFVFRSHTDSTNSGTEEMLVQNHSTGPHRDLRFTEHSNHLFCFNLLLALFFFAEFH